jgi:hypothetical protein
VNNFLFFTLVLHKRLCKTMERMGTNNENWQNQAGIMDINDRNDREIRDTRGLFIPVIENETKQERANRILAMMEESNNRLNRLLEIFNRMDR